MANNAFTISGATPTVNKPQNSPFSIGGTPQAKALSAAQSPAINWGALQLSPANSTTAKAKSQTVQHPDGTKVSTTYHVDEPAASKQASPAPKPDTGGITSGLLNVQSGLNSLQQEQKRNSFPGILSSLQTASAPNQTQTGLIKNLSDTAEGNATIANEAKKISDEYAKRIAQTGALGAGAVAGDLSTGTDVVGSGNAAIASQSASARMNALAQAQEAALQGTGQQLTAQGQTANAYGTALGGANTQQGQQISGLTSAAGLVQPSASFPFVFNPSSGTFTSPGTGGTQAAGSPSLTFNPQTDSQNLAKAVMNHQISYDDAIKALSYGSNSSNAAGQLSAAILAAGGNVSQLQAQNEVQGAQNVQVEQWSSALQQAKNLQSQLADLIQTFGLNPKDINAANIGLQQIAANASDPRYQALNSYLTDIASVYSNILTPPGGTQTDTTRSLAMGLLDGTAKGQSIIDQMKVLDNQAQAKISGVHTIQGSTPQGGSGNISVQAKDGQNYNFKFVNGKWVAI